MAENLRMQQQFLMNTGAMPMTTGMNAGVGMYGMQSVNPAVADIWTQASQMEQRYSAQLQNASAMGPAYANDVMNGFMMESMSLMFSDLQTPKVYQQRMARRAAEQQAKMQRQLEAQQNNSTAEIDNTKQTEVKDASDISDTENIENKEQAKDVKETENTENTNTENTSAEVKKQANAEDVEKLKQDYKEQVEHEVFLNKSENIEKAIKDENLSIADKKALIDVRTNELTNLGKKSDGKVEAMLIGEMQKGLGDGTLSAADAIKHIKEMKGGTKSQTKGNQIAGFKYNDSASFASALYVQAQKEGVLAEALTVLPPTPAIQKSLSLENETKAVTKLLTNLDENVKSKTGGKAENYGVSSDRAAKIRQDVNKLIEKASYVGLHDTGRTYISKQNYAKQVMEFLFDGKQNDYTDKEKMLAFELLTEGIKANYTKSGHPSNPNFVTDKTTDMEFFVKNILRDNFSGAAEEKYFTNIMNLYGNFDAKVDAPKTTTAPSKKTEVKTETPSASDSAKKTDSKVATPTITETSKTKETTKTDKKTVTTTTSEKAEVKADTSLSAADAIKTLKENGGIKSLKKGDEIAGFKYNDTASFASELYVQAQKEGRLAEALTVLPPTPAIQKTLSLENETKAVTKLLTNLDENVKSKTGGKAENYGVSSDRAAKIRQDVNKLIEKASYVGLHDTGRTYISKQNYAKQVMEFLFDGKQNDYTDKEKMLAFELLTEGIKANYTKSGHPLNPNFVTDKTTDMEFFVKNILRDNFFPTTEEKYFTNIMNLYGNFSK